jgi:hypothetical protein
MTDEEIIKEIEKDFKFSLQGLLLWNYGTEKRPKWYPVSETKYLIGLAKRFYELGLKENNICQQPH